MSEVKLGFVDKTVLVFIPDPASTDGSGKTGLVAANLTVSYTRVETDNDVVVTDVTSSLNNLAALTTAHTDWGLLEVSSTLAPGLYRLDIADAVFAAGAWQAVVYVMITTSAAAASPILFELVAYDPLDAVRLGLTALPNAAAEAAGGLYTRGSGAGQINQPANGLVDANAVRISGSAAAADNAEIVFDTDFAANYDTTNDVWKAAVTHWIATAVATPTVNGVPEVDVTHAAGTAVQAASGRFQVDLELWLGSAPNALAAGRVDATVGAMQADTITASAYAVGAIAADAFAAGAIDAAALAADAATEIATAVWASGTRILTALDEDTTTLDLDATIRAAVGLASANLDTQLDALPTAAENADAVWDEDATAHQTGGTFGQAIGDPGADTNTIYGAVVTGAAGATVAADIIAIKAVDDAIKAKTDSLTFTVANQVDSNVLSASGTAVQAASGRFQVDLELWLGSAPNALSSGRVDATVGAMQADVVTASAIAPDAIGSSELAATAVTEIRDAITGGAYALSTDANGRIRIVDGTGAGELDTSSGKVSITDGAISSATFAAGAIDSAAIATDAIGSAELAASAVTEIAAGISVPTANQVADALLDRADGIETGLTPRGAWRLMSAVLAGKVSGAGTGTEVFRNAVADSKARITATVDSSGNRTAITADAT